MPGLGKVSIAKLESKDSGGDDDSENAREKIMQMGQEIEAKRMIKALDSKDAKAFASALKAFLEMRF